MGANSDPQISLEQSDDGTFTATSASLPGYVARGETESAALRKIRKALKHHFKEHERDFVRITQRDAPDESFRWSRYRVPLAFRFPLSRTVKINVAAFCAGVALGISAFVFRKRRR